MEVVRDESSISFYKNKPFKTFVYLFKGNIHKVLISFLFYAIKHSPTWIIPIVTANIIDIATKPGSHNLNELWINLVIAALMVIQNILTNYLYIKFFSEASRSVEADLRSKLIRKLQILSISYHKQMKSGRIQSKILRDVEAINTLSRQICNGIMPIILNTTVALAVTFHKSLKVTMFFIVSMPVSYIIVKFFRKNIRKRNSDFRKEIEEMSSDVAEMVEMIPLTRAHALENVVIKKMDTELEKVKNKGYYLDVITSLFGSIAWVVFQVFQLACLGFTGYLAYKDQISVGDVVLYQSYFTSILNQVSSMVNIYPEIVKGFESINSVGEILLSDDVEENRGKKKVSEVKGRYEFINVGFKYSSNGEDIIKSFNLNVNAGECIAFVGESGAGKTTILNLIIGFNKPTGGSITIDGNNMADINLNSYRKFIAVVPQNTILFSGTIRDNITYGVASVSDEKLMEVIETANLADVFAKLPDGLNTQVGEHGDMLSGGQKQRIAIARALIRDPQIIVLDEATSALDNISEKYVQDAMKNLAKGRTTFIVAHRLSTIKDADRIVVIKNGVCAECGTYDELMEKKGEFYNINRMQA